MRSRFLLSQGQGQWAVMGQMQMLLVWQGLRQVQSNQLFFVGFLPVAVSCKSGTRSRSCTIFIIMGGMGACPHVYPSSLTLIERRKFS